MIDRSRTRLATFSSRMSSATSLLIVALAIAVGWMAIRYALDRDFLVEHLAGRFGGKELYLSSARASVIIMCMIIQVGLLFLALNFLRKALSMIATEQGIAPLAAGLIRRAGLFFAATVATSFILSIVVSALYGLGAPAGERFITVEIQSGQVMTLIMAGILVAFGHLITLAVEIDDDNRQII